MADDRRRPSAPYLHMREATKGKGPFTYKNGWNLERVGFLINDMLLYLQTVEKLRFREFGCTLDLRAYRKLSEEGYLFEDPVHICVKFCPFGGALAWFVHDYPGVIDSAHFFFDIDEPFKATFENAWKRGKELVVDPTGMREMWSLIKTVTGADAKAKPAMQAADLLAWSSIRNYTASEDTSFAHLEPIMKSIIPSSWIVFDEKNLRDKYDSVKKGSGFRVFKPR